MGAFLSDDKIVPLHPKMHRRQTTDSTVHSTSQIWRLQSRVLIQQMWDKTSEGVTNNQKVEKRLGKWMYIGYKEKE